MNVEVIAAATGDIVGKSDGRYNRVCSWSDPLNEGANALSVKYPDGSIAIYMHLRKRINTEKYRRYYCCW